MFHKNYQSLAHEWVHNGGDHHTPSRRMYSDGDRVYSYGSHYIIAERITDKSGNLIAFTVNSNGYSNTTRKHVTHIENAIPYNIPVIQCPGGTLVGVGKTRKFVEYLAERMKEAEDRLKRVRSSWSAQQHENTLHQSVKSWENFLEIAGKIDYWHIPELTDEQAKYLNQGSESFKEMAAGIRAKQLEKERQRNKEAAEKAENILAAWIAGETDRLPERKYIGDEAYLRIKDGKVETSQGAAVPVDDAKKLFRAIEAGQDVKGVNCGGFTVISMNGVLTIGCHKIERGEVFRIGNQL